MKPVTDPAILSQLNGADTSKLKPVTDTAILAQLNGAQAKKEEADEPSMLYNAFGGAEAIANMGTGMLAKPVSEVAGLAALGKELISPTPGGGDPQGFQRDLQSKMTYEPRTAVGQFAKENNPLALAGKLISKGADVAGNAVGGDAPSDSLRGMAGNAVREGIGQGAGLLGAKRLGAKLPDVVLSPEQQAVAAAQSKGYVVSPSMGRKNALNDFIDGHILGKAKSEQGASLKNQKLTDKDIKESFGLPEDEPITPEAMHDVRTKAGDSYDEIRSAVPNLVATKKYLTAILPKNLVGNKYANAVKEFPEKFKSKEIDALHELINRPRMTTAAAIDLVKSLRADSRINKGFNKTTATEALGDAQINAANAIEDMMSEQLAKAGKPDLFQKMLEARRTIAQSYVVENALSGRGSVSARAVWKAAEKAKKNGVLFTGPLADIAKTYKDFPKQMQDMNKVGLSPSGSPLTSGAAIHALMSGHPGIAAGIAAKGAVRPMFFSDWYQRNMAAPPLPGPRKPSALNYGLVPRLPDDQNGDEL